MAYSVTYETVTHESAEHGEADERGWVSRNSSLREALRDLFETRTSQCSGVESVEASSSNPESARYITVYNGMEYETGARENRSIHIPDHITPASRARLVAIVKAHN